MIDAALADAILDPLRQARLLPAAIQIADAARQRNKDHSAERPPSSAS
jgi:hypothetical protein